MGSDQAWGYVLPLGIWWFATAITAEAAANEKYKQLRDTDPDQYINAESVVCHLERTVALRPCWSSASGQ